MYGAGLFDDMRSSNIATCTCTPSELISTSAPYTHSLASDIAAHLDDVVGIRLHQRLGGEEAKVEFQRSGHALDDADRLRHAELLQLGTERLLLAVDLRASRDA